MVNAPLSVYIHIPFCQHRCSYCDFNTYSGKEDLILLYSKALQAELTTVSQSAESPLSVHTIFFGGGTPSLMPQTELEQILSVIDAQFVIQPGAEISLEANPGTVSATYLNDIFSIGINRLSLGVQSANPFELKLLERQHTFEDVIQAVRDARKARFDNINLDLLFGLPYQKISDWQRTIEFALQLAPEHFAVYALTLEHGTPMQHWTSRGLLSETDPDLAAQMYEIATVQLDQAGYEQYEISNWANRDLSGNLRSCQHNLQYWRGLPYLGFGAGAHGYVNGMRTANVLSPEAYIKRCRKGKTKPKFPQSAATVSVTQLDQNTEIGEYLMMGLRLTQEGVSAKEFRNRFGVGLESLFVRQISSLTRLGLLEWVGSDVQRLRLTPRGRLLGNRVFQEFI